MRPIALVLAALAALAPLAAATAQPEAPESPESLEQRVQKLEQEARERAARDFEFKVKGLLQADARFFADDEQTANDTFLLRRLEPSFEVTAGKFAFFKLQPQFAGDAVTTSDVYGELRFSPAATLRFGKFKTPLGLEYLQSSSATMFVERGLPSEVGVGRDFGVQLLGEVLAGTTTWALSYTNGAPDGRDAASTDTDNKKELGARLFFEPFRNEPGFFHGLGFGVGMTQGSKVGAIGSASATTATFNNTLPRYRSPAQSPNLIFSYLGSTTAPTVANTVVAAGDHTRLSPQLYFYRGGFGLFAEHMSSEQEVSINGVADTFEHSAWQVAASWLLTGEQASYKGARPNAPYMPGGEGWGAFEVAIRHGVLDIDDDVFPAYASPTASVSEAANTGVAVHWYLTANVRASLDYERTSFEGGAATGDRIDEKALLTRLQFSF